MRRGNGAAAIAELGRLRQVLERLAYVPRKVAVIAAPRISRLLRQQFRAGTDPYGRPWKPLKASTLARGRRPPPLTDTRALRDGTEAKTAPGGRAGIRLVVGRYYGVFHQRGFRVGKTRVPPRRILPQQGMPAAWSQVLNAAAKQAFREATRR